MTTSAGGVTLPELPKADKTFSRETLRGCVPVGYYKASTLSAYATRAVELDRQNRAALAGEWRDIASAPRDAPWWLIWSASYGRPMVVTQRMNDNTFWHGDWDWNAEATHWMPLPAAPLPKEPGR